MVKALYVDKDLLDEKIKRSGLRIDYLCELLALSRQGFDKKRKGITPFKVPEVFVLCHVLNIEKSEEEKIFYPKVEKEVD